MKKIKELLIFIALLVTPILVHFAVLGIGNLISPDPSFIGFNNYIRLFLNDKTFLSVLFNTFAMQIIISFIVSAVLAVIIFLLRKKIKAPRLIFYIGSISLGTVASLVRNVVLFLNTPNQIPDSLANALNYKPSIFDAISLQNIFVALYVGIITAFIFWILELIVSLFKKKGYKNEKQ